MATAKWKTTSSSAPYVVLEVNQGTQSVSDNTTKVPWSLKLYRPYEIISSASKAYSVIINGKNISGNTTIGGVGTKTIASGTETITHDGDGKKTIAFSFTLQLDITWSGYGQIGTASADNVLALADIPRVSKPTLNASSVNFGSGVTITTNRKSTAFTHTLQAYLVTDWENIATGVGVSFAWTVPLTYMNRIPNDPSAVINIKCITYNGSTKIGEEIINLTANVPSNIMPNFTTITHSENVANVKTRVGKYVQGLTKLNLAITGAVGAYGSTIEVYQITVSDTVIKEMSGVSETLKSSGAVAITGKVVDSRGRELVKTVNISVLAYTSPRIHSLTIRRASSLGDIYVNGTCMALELNASVSSLINTNNAQANELAYKVEIMRADTPLWTQRALVSVGDIVFPPKIQGWSIGKTFTIKDGSPLYGTFGGSGPGNMIANPDPRFYSHILNVTQTGTDDKGDLFLGFNRSDPTLVGWVGAGNAVPTNGILLDGFNVDYSYRVKITISDFFSSITSFGVVGIGEALMQWARNSMSIGVMMPGTEYNLYIGNKGIKSYGKIIDKNDIEVIGMGGTIVDY